MKSSNNPWTIRQLKMGGGYVTHNLCTGLIDKGFIIKIDMGNEEPMYAINLKKITKSTFPSKRSAPLPMPGDQSSAFQAKTARLNPVSAIQISSKIAHDSINKNPISAIIELAQANGLAPAFNITRTSGPTNRKKFHMRLTMGDRTFDSVATSKKVAKQNVAELALRMLHSERSGAVPVSTAVVDVSQKSSRDPEILVDQINEFTPIHSSTIEGTGFFGKVGRFSYDTYNKLAASVHLSTVGRKVISVFIIEDSRSGLPLWSAVSLGSGNRTVNGDNINFEGKTVNDSHAEITARRGFRRFLWKQLRTVTGKEGKAMPFDAVLEETPGGKYRLNHKVRVHLFISTAPCGDSAIFPISEATQSNEHVVAHDPTMENEKQGLLRSKMESGQGTNPTSSSEDPLTIDGIMMGDQRLKTMSCSDKVSRWNILGLQGCLLSEYLEPVYLSSLTLGCLYHHGHLSRAVCCRYNDIPLPAPYRLNHPLLGCVPGQEAERELGKTNEMSMNWCAGDDKVEVLDGCRGRCAKGVISRLARVSVLKEYEEFSGAECKDYNKVKERITEYCEAKEVYNKFVKEKNYGVWIKKPAC
ncbi:double-stranded RNA-specific adenosine deaminase-like isoform X3 [Bolinopsis microptera]